MDPTFTLTPTLFVFVFVFFYLDCGEVINNGSHLHTYTHFVRRSFVVLGQDRAPPTREKMRQPTNGQPGKGIWLNNKYKNQMEINNNKKQIFEEKKQYFE